jgi:hypothetical protein
MYRGTPTSHLRRTLAIAAGAAAIATTLAPPAHAALDTESVNASTVAFGTVRSESGVPLSGVGVYLIAERINDPSPGNAITMPVLDADVTDSLGHYTLDLPETFNGSAIVDPSTGLATFNVMVHGPDLDTLATVETALVGAAKSGQRSKPEHAHRITFGGAVAKKAEVESWSEVAADFVDTMPSDPTVVYPAVDDGGDDYSGKVAKAFVTLVRGFGGRWTAVGAWFSNTTGVNATFAYANGATSSLGVAVSDTAVGGFHAESTHTESSTNGQGFARLRGPQSVLFRTLFTYKEFKYRLCGGRPPGPACFGTVYKVEPVGWRGGGDIQQTGNPGGFAHYCVPEPPGGSWHRTDSKAITWTNGVSLKQAIGIDLSSQTGYTSEATLDINFPEGGHQLCGRGAYPGRTPYLLMARA